MIDLRAGVAQIASTSEDDLWAFELSDGRGLQKAMTFIKPYITEKAGWPYGEDIAYVEHWAVRHPPFIFAADTYEDCSYCDLVKELITDSDVREVTRNFPLRHPILWME